MLVDVVKIVVFLVSLVGAFFWLALLKTWAFFGVMFFAIFAFRDDQEQALTNAVGKVIAVAFKTVLITASAVLALFAMSLLDSLEIYLTDTFFKAMPTLIDDGYSMGNTIKQAAASGLTHVLFVGASIFMAMKIIFTLPGWFLALIGMDKDVIGDQMTNNVIESIEKQSTKGL